MANKPPRNVAELKKMFVLGNKEKSESSKLMVEIGINGFKLHSIKC